MADRYWVGGNGTWDAASTTHWSASSGGANGASVPTSADIVHFDTNSTTSVVTLSGALNCLDLVCEGTFTGRFAGSGTIAIAGSLTYRAGMGTNTNTGTFTFTATTTGKTITSAGNSMPNLNFDGVGGGWTLQDDLITPVRTHTVTNGALNINGKTITCARFSSSNSNVRVISGMAALNLSGTDSVPLQFGTVSADVTGLTFNGSNAVITLTTLGTTTYSFRINGQSVQTVLFMGVGTGTVNIVGFAGNSTIGTLTNRGGRTITFAAGITYTITAWDVTAPDGSPVRLQSGIAGIASILNYVGAGVVSGISLIVKDITATPANTWFDRGLPVATMNVSGNTGWIFSARRTLTQARSVATARTAAGPRALAAARTSTG